MTGLVCDWPHDLGSTPTSSLLGKETRSKETLDPNEDLFTTFFSYTRKEGILILHFSTCTLLHKQKQFEAGESNKQATVLNFWKAHLFNNPQVNIASF